MKVVIIGNGPAGTTAASRIRNLNEEAEIIILSFEKYSYYARPRLHELIEGKVNEKDIQVFKPEWYQKNNINLLLNSKVIKIDIDNQKIITKDQNIPYDKLLLAIGAKPRIPKIEGVENENVFTLRTIDDALTIKKAVENKKEILFIGGGLLGLEIASSFSNGNRKIKVIEVNNSLLHKQLDFEKGQKLKGILEEKGFLFYMNETCEKISDTNSKIVVKTKSGKEIEGEILIISAGVFSRIKLAEESGLKVERGIIVDRYLQTSAKNIYAAGDCAEFEAKVYGFVKSAIEQGNIAAENIVLGNKKEYLSTKVDVKLKIKDIDLNNL